MGETQGSACDQCRDDENHNPGFGTGRFVGCVVAEKPDGTKFFNGACASCRFYDNTGKCSLIAAAINGRSMNMVMIGGPNKGRKEASEDKDKKDFIPGGGGPAQTSTA